MSNAGAAIAAIRLRKEHQIVKALRERAALSQTSATPLPAPSGLGRGALKALLRSGAVVDVGNGSYYLNDEAYNKMRTRRRMMIGVVLLVVLIALAANFFIFTPPA